MPEYDFFANAVSAFDIGINKFAENFSELNIGRHRSVYFAVLAAERNRFCLFGRNFAVSYEKIDNFFIRDFNVFQIKLVENLLLYFDIRKRSVVDFKLVQLV